MQDVDTLMAGELVKEFCDTFQADCDALDCPQSIIDLASEVFSIPYSTSIVKACWPVFRRAMERVDPENSGGQVVGVDFSGLFHAYWHIYEEQAATRIREKLSRLREQMHEGPEDRFIVAIDPSGASWRKAYWPEYKKSREAKPKNFIEAYTQTIRQLQEADFRTEQADGMESDDVLASMAFRAKLRKHKAILIADDKDLWQCLGPGVAVYAPRADEYRNAKWLEVNHHIQPNQVVDWLCLTGKDDVPSAHKIGPTTASKWLQQFDNFQSIYEARHTFKESKRKTLESFAEKDYWLARTLHTLDISIKLHW